MRSCILKRRFFCHFQVESFSHLFLARFAVSTLASTFASCISYSFALAITIIVIIVFSHERYSAFVIVMLLFIFIFIVVLIPEA